MSNRLLVFLLLLALGSGPASGAGQREPPPRPHIVLMLADNLGYGDVGAYGGGALRGAPTPNLDGMAFAGLRLTNFNVEPECTPSRAALMTGRLPVRSGTAGVPLLGSVGDGPGKPRRPYGLDPWEVTLAEVLSSAGYRTALFGKWHLGNSAGRFPHEQGFDRWWGYPNSSRESIHDSDPAFDPEVASAAHLMEGTRGEAARKVEVFDLTNRPLVDERITRRSVDYIRENAGSERPFFLMTSFFQVHFPSLPHPDFRGRSANGDYADSVIELDHRVGQILAAVDQSGSADRTLVLFLSDNGALLVPRPGAREHWIGNNGPFRGELGTTLEGSIRTIGILRWPGRIEAGRVSNEIVSMLDMLPTLAALAGAELPRDRPIDGIDQTSFLLGKQARSRREHALFFVGERLRAVKWRRYKIHFYRQDTLLGPVLELRAPEIYNVEQDPREENNIALLSMWVMEPVGRHIQEYIQSLSPDSDRPGQ